MEHDPYKAQSYFDRLRAHNQYLEDREYEIYRQLESLHGTPDFATTTAGLREALVKVQEKLKANREKEDAIREEQEFWLKATAFQVEEMDFTKTTGMLVLDPLEPLEPLPESSPFSSMNVNDMDIASVQSVGSISSTKSPDEMDHDGQPATESALNLPNAFLPIQQSETARRSTSPASMQLARIGEEAAERLLEMLGAPNKYFL